MKDREAKDGEIRAFSCKCMRMHSVSAKPHDFKSLVKVKVVVWVRYYYYYYFFFSIHKPGIIALVYEKSCLWVYLKCLVSFAIESAPCSCYSVGLSGKEEGGKA